MIITLARLLLMPEMVACANVHTLLSTSSVSGLNGSDELASDGSAERIRSRTRFMASSPAPNASVLYKLHCLASSLFCIAPYVRSPLMCDQSGTAWLSFICESQPATWPFVIALCLIRSANVLMVPVYFDFVRHSS